MILLRSERRYVKLSIPLIMILNHWDAGHLLEEDLVLLLKTLTGPRLA